MPGSVKAGADLTDALLGLPPWQPLSLINSWVNQGGVNSTAQWRFVPLMNQIEVVGSIQSGTISDNTAIANAISGPFPVTQLLMAVTPITSGSLVQSPAMYLDTAGVLRIIHIPTGTTALQFHNYYPVDS